MNTKKYDFRKNVDKDLKYKHILNKSINNMDTKYILQNINTYEFNKNGYKKIGYIIVSGYRYATSDHIQMENIDEFLDGVEHIYDYDPEWMDNKLAKKFNINQQESSLELIPTVVPGYAIIYYNENFDLRLKTKLKVFMKKVLRKIWK